MKSIWSFCWKTVWYMCTCYYFNHKYIKVTVWYLKLMVLNTSCLWIVGMVTFDLCVAAVLEDCDWPYGSVLIFILMTFIPTYYMIDQLCCTWRKRLLFIVTTWCIRMVSGVIYSFYVAFTTLNVSHELTALNHFSFWKPFIVWNCVLETAAAVT